MHAVRFAAVAAGLVVWAAAVSLWAPGAAFAAGTDVEGSADYPDIGRFEGAWITRYDVKDFDEYWLASGPVQKAERGEGTMLEGRVVRIGYRVPAGPSVLEVARNYENRLTEAGYEILHTCRDKECGGYNFRYYGTEVLPAPAMTVDLGDFRYIAAVKKGDPTVHAAILVSINNGEVLNQVMVVETGAMEDRMVDAKEMAQSISDTGKIAIYGILFDLDKADIKPESRPALDQIAELMKNKPELSILVVGHTDNQGSMEYNLDLSMRRARAIVAELTGAYGVAADRLSPAGAGFLSPVASNRTDAGRAENRRVELVER
ncbi:OmpA family protein [Nitratireductor sp. GCM10026969]|uniref:OmpA family protein n=1 Tax=Nitratireductor sp. GCM10026969 TaxID=3252645 RepID=UPI00361A9281